jgi:hypothetical protein
MQIVKRCNTMEMSILTKTQIYTPLTQILKAAPDAPAEGFALQ